MRRRASSGQERCRVAMRVTRVEGVVIFISHPTRIRIRTVVLAFAIGV